MIRRSVACLAFTALFSITPAAAQQADTLTTSLRPGVRSLSFGGLGGSSGAFQYWRMRSERTNLGVMVTLGADYSHGERRGPERDVADDQASVSISVGPVLRRYATTRSKVNPFLYGEARAGYSFHVRQVSAAPETHTQQAVIGTVGAGLGAEWFPVRSISFSGQTGLQLGSQYNYGEFGVHNSEEFGLSVSTFTSSLFVNLCWLPRVR
jgi:hypothetical protein